MKHEVNKARKAVAERLKAGRKARGLSQGMLADLAGIDRKTINRIENGHFSPNMDTFFRLCKVLNIKPSEFMKNAKV